MILRCVCCGLPIARIDGTKLVIVSQHHRAHHTSTVDIGELHGAAQGGPKPAVESKPYRIDAVKVSRAAIP